ncbi:ATP-binding cassette domain-containing protein [Candidatus Pelagibacter sp. HIMB1509]|uniref:ATP-binding cassette domain-containing protein n=1 Tax=Candidatus Pelagibacter sp. HIMB1509 TaxID=3413339 RepID=UPI003F839E0C
MRIIELKNLSLSYKTKSFIPNDKKNLHLPKDEEFYALKDINLSIEKKSVVGLYGPNGAGKSTLLKVIGKILKPNSGTVFTKYEPELMSSSQFNLLDEATGYENVKLFLKLKNIEENLIDKKIQSIKEIANINEFFFKPVKVYSSGMRFRISFACLEQINSKIILMDEWLSTADKNMREYVSNSMNNKISNTEATIIASHNFETLKANCTHILYMNEGKIIKIEKNQ